MRQVTAMPISTGFPRQSLIFWRLLLRVMILSESFLPVVSTSMEVVLSPVVAFTPRIDAGTEGVDIVVAFTFQGAIVVAEQGEH